MWRQSLSGNTCPIHKAQLKSWSDPSMFAHFAAILSRPHIIFGMLGTFDYRLHAVQSMFSPRLSPFGGPVIENPFMKATLKLTRLAQLLKESPERFAAMKAEAIAKGEWSPQN